MINDPIKCFIEANNTAFSLSQDGKFEDAKPYIDEAIEIAALFVNSCIDIPNFTPKTYAKVFAMAGYIYGELGDEETSINYYKHYQFLKTQLKHSFPDINYITLFQFRSDKPYTITNLKENQFTFASPREQNDIVDCPVFAWLDFVLDKKNKFNKHIPFLKKSFEGYRIASFCQDFDNKRAIENTLMWAHYADCHRGFCIQYQLHSSDFRRDDKSKLFAARLFKVDYLTEDNSILDLSDPNGTLSSKAAYFTKSSDWQYENEVRMVCYDPSNSENYPPFKLGDKSRISAIYFGVKCTDSTKNKVKDALLGRSVKFFQMEISPHNIYSLNFKEISI